MIPADNSDQGSCDAAGGEEEREIVKYTCCLDNDSCECDLADVVGDTAEDADTDLGEFSRFL